MECERFEIWGAIPLIFLKVPLIYIFVDSETAQYLDNCYTHDMHGLNTSDHLPISANLSLQTTESTEKGNTQLSVNWEQAVSTGVLQSYQDSIQGAIADIIGRAYATVEDLDDEIRHVSLFIKDAAQVLPKCKRPKKAKKWYRDATLFRLSKEKKVARDTWKREGVVQIVVLFMTRRLKPKMK